MGPGCARELQIVAARLLGELPVAETADVTITSLAPVIVADGGNVSEQ
jgi:hypothetical protein